LPGETEVRTHCSGLISVW